ncbi:hypothetical protein ACFLSA_00675 [Bacteroidota bacterium]
MKKFSLFYGVFLLVIILSIFYSAKQVSEEGDTETSFTIDEEMWVTWKSSYLQLSDAGLKACYRKDLELTANVRKAEISFYIKNTPYWIMVNNDTVVQPLVGGQQLEGLKNLDITAYLQQGKNSIAFSYGAGSALDTWMSTEGIVFCDDGTTIRILTDGWIGGWDIDGNWTDPATTPVDMDSITPGSTPLEGYPDDVYMHPYYGPIQVDPVAYPTEKVMSQPFFNEDISHTLLKITLLNMQQFGMDSLILWAETFSEAKGKSVSKQKINLSPKGSLDLAGRINLGKLPKGAYNVRLILKKDSVELEQRDYEIVRVGKYELTEVEGTHYEDGMQLKEVYSIDCSAETSPETFVASHTNWGEAGYDWKEVETVVLDGPQGQKYRSLADITHMYYFAYKYEIEKLYVPHLAVVEWPDDKKRNFIIHIKEPGTGSPYYNDGNAGYQRSEAGYISQHDLFPERSNEMKKIHLLFWPNSKQGSIFICNVGPHEVDRYTTNPGAASKITFYEITSDLPKLRIKDAGDHLIGPHTERGPYTLASMYYSGPLGTYFVKRLGIINHPLFYHNWYVTTENLIKRMLFSGQNLYMMGHLMIQSTLYASDMSRYGYSQNSYYGGDVTRDNVGLMLRMFKNNGISMISGVEHLTVDVLADNQPTPEEIRAGVDHEFMVGRDGNLFPLHACRYTDGRWHCSGQPNDDGTVRWPAMNFFHPNIQERILAIVGELAHLYGQYPAWKGVGLFASRVFQPMDPALLRSDKLQQAGYEDFTIKLFEKETGINIPVDFSDPDRFEKRYQWIQTTIPEEWTNWRCEKYTELFRRIRDTIAGDRPDVKLYLVLGEPMLWSGSQEIMDGHYDDSTFLVNMYKRFGYDLLKLKNEQGIVPIPTYAHAGSAEALSTDGHEGWLELTLNMEYQEMFANNEKGGAYIKNNFPHLGAYTFPAGRWQFTTSGTRQGWLWSTYVTETFVRVLSRSNPTVMPTTWMDVCESLGRIQENRVFAKAYRSLPSDKYERFTGNGLDRNIWISATQNKGVRYAYVSNNNWWQPEVSLYFSDGVLVHDLIKDTVVTLQNKTWNLKPEPYSVQTFRITGGNIDSAKVTINPNDRIYIQSKIDAELNTSDALIVEGTARESELSGKNGWESFSVLKNRTEQIRERLSIGDIAGAYTLIHGALPIAQYRINLLLDGKEITRTWQ